jgi:hypothetical protein
MQRSAHARLALLAMFLCADTAASLSCSLDLFGQLTACDVGAHEGLHGAEVALFPLGPFVALANGEDHVCAVRHPPPHDVACWPPTAAVARLRPTWLRGVSAVSGGAAHACAIWGPRHTLTCWGSLRDGNNTETLGTARNISRGVRMLAKTDTGARTVCFLRESNNDISCFGDNNAQQLGLGLDGSDADFVGPAAIRGDAINVLL